MAKSVVETFSEHTVAALAKRVNKDMNQVCKSNSNSILKQRCDGTNFSWEKIWTELQEAVANSAFIFSFSCQKCCVTQVSRLYNKGYDTKAQI